MHLVTRTKETEEREIDGACQFLLSLGPSLEVPMHETMFPYPVITELELQDISVTSDLLQKPSSIFFGTSIGFSFTFNNTSQERIYKPELPKGL